MLRAMDWDRYWRFELARRRKDPVDFRKWKRDSQRELKKLYPGAPLLLDSTAGLGDHTVNLAEEGFQVEACDPSPVAREATARAVRDAGLDVEVFDARWESLGRQDRYALIFNDALHWIYEEQEMMSALRGLYDALAPGGALVIFFADAREPDEGAGLRILEWDWEHIERERVAWDVEIDGARTTLSVLAERGPDFIDEHHVYHVRTKDGLRLETLTMRRVYRWDWHRLSRALVDAGFADLRSDAFANVKGYTFAMNRAHKKG